jgi:hypothetical protein
MRRNRSAAFALSTGLALIVAAACSDTMTPPDAPSGFAVGDVSAPPQAAQLTKLIVCKTGDTGGSFDVTRTAIGASTGTVSGPDTPISAGQCKEVANDDGASGIASNVTIDEDAADGVTQTVVSCRQIVVGGSETDCSFTDGGSLVLNSFHGYVITYNNDEEEVPEICTYTKGWYRNNGSDTVEGLDGLTKAQVQAIFNATPGKPGNVTFTSNNLLNLYQQLAAAILNGGATSGIDDVEDAIDDALLGTTVTVNGTIAITTDLSQEEISDLIETLSSFNEGDFEGAPHCDDEVLSVD